MAKILRTPEAIDDINDIWRYVATQDRTIADTILNRIETGIRLLRDFPAVGAPRPRLGSGVRVIVVGSFNIYYRVSGEDVLILRVLRHSRHVTRKSLKP